MKFELLLDKVPFTAKPISKDVAGIKTRFASCSPASVSVEELGQAVVNGRTFTPAVLVGGAKAENWKRQQLFCVDIDNADKQHKPLQNPLTVEQCIAKTAALGMYPALVYSTFSSKPELPKFRACYLCNRVITDPAERERIQTAFHALFEGYADTACINADRLFFGGKEILHMNPEAVFDPAQLPVYEVAEQVKGTPQPAPKDSFAAMAFCDKDLDALKRSFDFYGYLQQITGQSGRESGNRIGFNPCPVCGHHDDFYFYRETNTFCCFSTSGDVGGSIIDFLMAREHLDRVAAIEKFKYELCGIDRAEEKRQYREKKMIAGAQNVPGVAPGQLPEYIITSVNEKTGEVKFAVSCPLLAAHIRKHTRYLFVRGGALEAVQRYWYRDGAYRPMSDEELQGYIKGFVERVDPTLLKMRDVKEVFGNLTTDLNFVNPDALDADPNIINFKNGLLHLDTMQLTEHDSKVYSTIQIPCNWNPQAAEAPVFKAFLQRLTSYNGDVMRLLKQFIGVCLSNVPGYRFKKALFLVGPGNTGKSQLKALVERLLGKQNCASIDLSALEERFGSSSLHRKRLCGSSDMSFVSVKELKIFKTATGGDSIHAEHKGEKAFDFTYSGLLWFCMNELPKFGGDTGEWVYDRIMIVRCENVIPAAEQDKLLLEKLYAEREAIVQLCVKAFVEACAGGYRFDIPESCVQQRRAYQIENNVVWKFYEECCIPYDGGRLKLTRKTQLYQVFKAWCADNSRCHYVPSNQEFKKELAAAIGMAPDSLELKKTDAIYYKIIINAETQRDYGMQFGVYGANIAS